MAPTQHALHPYQLVARDFLRGRPRAALWLDMGLGKTAATLTALEPRHLPCLVVAPKRVAEHVWPHETALWRPDLTCLVASGTPTQRKAALGRVGPAIVALGRDNLRDALLAPREHPFRTVVLDEMSGFKTKSSVRWRAAATYIRKHRVPHVWGLTGTPSPNGFLDLWGQIALLDEGQRLGKNLTTYRSRYFSPGRQLASGVIIEWLLRPGAADQIKAALQDLVLAMGTEGRIALPDVTYNDIGVELPPKVREVYRTFERDLVVDLKDLFGGEVHTAANAATMTARLSQVTSGFMYVDEAATRGNAYTELHTAKLDALREIVEAAQGSPLLVFYRFTAERDIIAKAFPKLVWTIDDKDVFTRWNQGEVPILLAHPASAGHGLNLQHGGHTVVWTSPTWNLEHYQQANKRLARQGQTHPVVIHHLLASKTIDHLVRRRLAAKAATQLDLLQYLDSPVG